VRKDRLDARVPLPQAQRPSACARRVLNWYSGVLFESHQHSSAKPKTHSALRLPYASFEDCQRAFRTAKLPFVMFALQPELKIFGGSANRDLAERICKYVGVPLGQATISSFPDGETYVRIEENIRGHDVFIIQPTCP